MTVSEIYAILVIEIGYNPSYVLDEMQWYEIKAALKYSYLKHKESWEQTRFIVHSIYQVNHKNKIDFEDIMKFPWDSNDEDKKITKKDIERLNNMASSYLNTIKNNGN